MLADNRGQAKLREFFLQWLKVDQAPDIAKDRDAFPRLRCGHRRRPADLARTVPRRRDLERRSDFRQLLLADELYLNGRLAKFYGVDAARRRAVSEGEARIRSSGPAC